jgi:hypothetical protein
MFSRQRPQRTLLGVFDFGIKKGENKGPQVG